MKIELLFITPNAEKLMETAGRTAYLPYAHVRKSSELKSGIVTKRYYG